MRITNIMLPLAVCLAIVGAYAAGHYIGKLDAQGESAVAISNLEASRSAEAFMIASSARQALRNSQPAQAELVLVRYAALQAPALLECSSLPGCAVWVGGLLPTKMQVEDIVAAERATRGAN